MDLSARDRQMSTVGLYERYNDVLLRIQFTLHYIYTIQDDAL